MNTAMALDYRITLHGMWADAWLYKDQLILWDRANQMHVVQLEHMRRAIRRKYGDTAVSCADYALFRNDWKKSAPFASLLGLPGVANALLCAYATTPNSLSISPEELEVVSPPTEPPSGTLVDSTMYANRVFLASTDGLFQSYLDPAKPKNRHPQDRILDFAVSGVRAKYMSVNASALDQGLWFKGIESGAAPGYFKAKPPVRIDDYSVKTQFVYRDLLNYTTDRSPGLLMADANKALPHSSAQHEEWRVTGYSHREDFSDTHLIDAAREIEGEARPNELRVIGNSYRQLLIQHDDHLYVTSLRSPRRSAIATRARRTGLPTRASVSGSTVLETHPIGEGFLVETLDDVRYIDRTGARVVHYGEVARVRTFKDSMRYQDAAIVVHEQGIDLLGSMPQLPSMDTEAPYQPPTF